VPKEPGIDLTKYCYSHFFLEEILVELGKVIDWDVSFLESRRHELLPLGGKEGVLFSKVVFHGLF
jgi:hypothetical protein